jgi:hypothetical protein
LGKVAGARSRKPSQRDTRCCHRNPSNRLYADYVAQNEAAAKLLGLRLQMLPVARAEQFDEAFVAIKREKADALVVGPDSLYISRMQEISDRASTSRRSAHRTGPARCRNGCADWLWLRRSRHLAAVTSLHRPNP